MCHNSVNWYFLYDQMHDVFFLKKHAWVKSSVKELDRLIMTFNRIEWKKLIDMVSSFASQLTFKKIPLVEL